MTTEARRTQDRSSGAESSTIARRHIFTWAQTDGAIMEDAITATIIPFPVRSVPEETLSVEEDLARLLENLKALVGAAHEYDIAVKGALTVLQGLQREFDKRFAK